MEEFTGANSPYARCVEWLFSQANDNESWLGGRAPVAPPPRPAPEPVELPADWPQEPPALDHPEGVRAAQAWFQAERARLEAYTKEQFRRIRERDQEALSRHYQREADMARREREVSREVQFLTAQAE